MVLALFEGVWFHCSKTHYFEHCCELLFASFSSVAPKKQKSLVQIQLNADENVYLNFELSYAKNS